MFKYLIGYWQFRATKCWYFVNASRKFDFFLAMSNPRRDLQKKIETKNNNKNK